MKPKWVSAIVCLAAMMLLCVRAAAQQPGETPTSGRDSSYEQEVYRRLAEAAPDAVPVFREATSALDAGHLEAAKKGYERVLELAPGFGPAERRLSYVELELGNSAAAVERARQAYAHDDSAYSLQALARALLSTGDPADAKEALTHAKAAAEALPDDGTGQYILLYAGLAAQDIASVRQASAALVRLQPDLAVGHYFAGLVAANDGRWEKAERELRLAQDLGWPEEEVRRSLDDGIAVQARQARWRRAGIYAFAAWIAGLGILFLAGMGLSRATLATVRGAKTGAQAVVTRAERTVRSLYRVVIAATSVYFYLSIPLLVLALVGVVAGIVYVFAALGQIPIRPILYVGIVALYSLVVVVRSLLARVREGELGRQLSREEAPKLWALAQRVAERVETRPVDVIYVTPAPNIGVTERGGLWQGAQGKGQRCLVLGLGALPGMSQGQLQAVLAHEYGHFSNRDTAGGDLARRVQGSMSLMLRGLTANGLARWYNPDWLFLASFYHVFLRVTLGASRLQEILADRYAALAYGVQQFVDGLMHVARQGLAFELQVAHEVEQARALHRDLQNLYTLPLLEGDLQAKLEKDAEGALSRPTSPLDSHPSVHERIALVQSLGEAKVSEEPREPAWELLQNAQALQQEMTATVQANALAAS
jgi:Zn-dependent protease with chaperone function